MPNSIGVAAYLGSLIGVTVVALQLHALGWLGPWFLILVFLSAVLLSRLLARRWPLPRLGEPAGETLRHIPFVLFCVAANSLLARPLMFLLAGWLAHLLPASPASFLNGVSLWILVPGCLIAYECMGYLQHLALHKVGFVWRSVHSTHHEPPRYGTFLALRIHYLEYFFSQLTRLLLLHALGVDPGVILIVVSISWFGGVLQHTDTSLRFGWLNHFIFTPETHIWHHDTELRVNFGFGLLTVFDKMGGTFWYPSGRLPGQLGIRGWHERGLMDAVFCRATPVPREAPGSALTDR